MEENKEVNEREEFELTASEEAIKYLSTIEKEDWDAIQLSEELITVPTNGKGECGKFSIVFKPGIWQEKDCYVIHVTEETIEQDIPTVTNIIAHVDQAFTTLEHSVLQYVKTPDKVIDKKTLMVLQDGKYVVQRTVTQDEFERKTHETYSLKQLPGFICEGCHVIFQRILLRKGIPGGMSFLTFDSEANLSTMSFEMLENEEVKFKDVAIARGIRSKILSSLEPEQTWDSFFLPRGHLIFRSKIGSDVIARQLNLPRPPTPAKTQAITPLKWEKDMQLLSQYNDRKEQLMDEHKSYVRRHPELQALLSDFVQFLLLRKPENVLEFAEDFFGGMSLMPKIENV